MTKNPLVSVIIPVYNREHHIQSSIYSVLNQTYKNLEVIVIDDASTDLTGNKVLEITDSRLKYFKNEKNFTDGLVYFLRINKIQINDKKLNLTILEGEFELISW